MPTISPETLAVAGCATLLVAFALALGALGRAAAAGSPSSFHRGLSFGLLGDAALVVVVGSALNPALPDLVLLGVLLGVTLLVAARLARQQPGPAV